MNLLFDLDGTLTDPFLGITNCIRHALSALGRRAPDPEALRWCIGPPLKKSFLSLLETDDDELAERALAKYRERFATTGMFENARNCGMQAPSIASSRRWELRKYSKSDESQESL